MVSLLILVTAHFASQPPSLSLGGSPRAGLLDFLPWALPTLGSLSFCLFPAVHVQRGSKRRDSVQGRKRKTFGERSLQKQGDTTTIAGELCVAQQECMPDTASPRGTPSCEGNSSCAVRTKIHFVSIVLPQS